LATTIQIADVRICLDDEGSGAPLLLLHGFPATRYLWSRVIPPLVRAGYRVIAPDLVGYGESEAPAHLRIDMASQAGWMLALLDRLGLSRVSVIAHDVGTAAAQLMVIEAPRRVRGLALLDGVLGDNWAIEAVSSIQVWDPANAHKLFPVLRRRLGKSEALIEMLKAYQGERGGLCLIRAARDLDPRQTAAIGERLSTAAVPAAVLWGEHDDFLSIEGVGQALAKLLGTALIRLPGGHFTPLDCPAEVADALCVFLKSLPPAAHEPP
jgi:pimeloyl-ACP methyl ester carboxylesterase